MPEPTISIFLNEDFPAAPEGDQNVNFQSDGVSPQQAVTAFPSRATPDLCGTVKPDNVTITITDDGTISSTAGSGVLKLYQEIPAGEIDGTNTVYTLTNTPNPSSVIYALNGVLQNPLITPPEYTISGATLTVAQPLQPASATNSADTHLITYWA